MTTFCLGPTIRVFTFVFMSFLVVSPSKAHASIEEALVTLFAHPTSSSANGVLLRHVVALAVVSPSPLGAEIKIGVEQMNECYRGVPGRNEWMW